jgi:hypothetical protein
VSVRAPAGGVVGSLPHDVRLSALEPHSDDRGIFLELFRREWATGVDPVQWNAVHSNAGVLRGVHVHPRHDDYLIVLRGRATIGLRDLRDDSRSAGAAACVELDEERPTAISIPHGVAHRAGDPLATGGRPDLGKGRRPALTGRPPRRARNRPGRLKARARRSP